MTKILLEVRRLAQILQFDDASTAKIVTAASELLRNVLKYADRGMASVQTISSKGRNGIEVVVKDKGPGIEDMESALSDHFSSGGTLGLGLPGVRRLVDEFEIQSSVGEGTRVRIAQWVSP
jgi:serine/threonine-protein kinase RsbT